jgi:hypothetical protein
MKYLALFVLIFMSVNGILIAQKTMKDNVPQTTIIGRAVNAKAVAYIIDDKETVYQIQGLNFWKEFFLNKRLAVKGIVAMEEQEEILQNEKGEYKAGAIGKMNIIKEVVLPETTESIALVVVLRKGLPKKVPKQLCKINPILFPMEWTVVEVKDIFIKSVKSI